MDREFEGTDYDNDFRRADRRVNATIACEEDISSILTQNSQGKNGVNLKDNIKGNMSNLGGKLGDIKKKINIKNVTKSFI